MQESETPSKLIKNSSMKLQKDVYLPFQNLAEFISNIFLIFHATYDETEVIEMGRTFDDYPGFQPKTTPATQRKYLGGIVV